MNKLMPLLLVAALLSACVTKPIDYYYGGYEKAYYHAKKTALRKASPSTRRPWKTSSRPPGRKGSGFPQGYTSNTATPCKAG